MLIKLVEQKNEEIYNLKVVNEKHRIINGELRVENKDLQKSVEYINEAYQDIGKKFFELDEKTCLHCGSHKPDYCEECYQKLIAENVALQSDLKKSSDYVLDRYDLKEKVNKQEKIIKALVDYIHVNEYDLKISHNFCDGTIIHCKHPDDHHCKKCILEYFEKKVDENEVQKAQTEEM